MRFPVYDSYDVFIDHHCVKRIHLFFRQLNNNLKNILGQSFDLKNYNLDYSQLLDIDWLDRFRNIKSFSYYCFTKD